MIDKSRTYVVRNKEQFVTVKIIELLCLHCFLLIMIYKTTDVANSLKVIPMDYHRTQHVQRVCQNLTSTFTLDIGGFH